VPYAFFYDVPGDERIYRRVKSEIGEGRPEGLLLHLVVKRADGLRHINVWETQQQWERYQRERVLAASTGLWRRSGSRRRRPPRPRRWTSSTSPEAQPGRGSTTSADASPRACLGGRPAASRAHGLD
jgi:hypothetical protein